MNVTLWKVSGTITTEGSKGVGKPEERNVLFIVRPSEDPYEQALQAMEAGYSRWRTVEIEVLLLQRLQVDVKLLDET